MGSGRWPITVSPFHLQYYNTNYIFLVWYFSFIQVDISFLTEHAKKIAKLLTPADSWPQRLAATDIARQLLCGQGRPTQQ